MPQQEANEPEEASNLLPLASPDSTAIQSPVHLLEAKSPSKTLGSNFRSKKSASLIILTAAAIVILLFHSKTLSYFLSTYFSSCDSRKSSSWIAGNSEVSSGEENSENEHSETDLDFAVIGFPKTGTTFLLEVLGRHKEIVMILSDNVESGGEFCQIHHKDGDKELLPYLKNKTLDTEHRKFGIKCPTMVRNTNSIDNLAKISRHTRLIVGVRHPASWFQSFYNYRVMGTHLRNESLSDIPNPNTLNATTQWKDVSTSYARFDIYLKQFAKVQLDEHDLKEMLEEHLWKKEISPTKFKIFIYTVEQLNDANSTRQAGFRNDLQKFLGLETPFPDFDSIPKVNENHEVFPEYLDICKPEYNDLRHLLLEEGKKSSHWIGTKFIYADDVVVSNEDHFQSALSTW
eukprot:CAMPEP_0171400362 /NCGR_PEP_ID=MMETSP0880-20121228/7225_1 /TAXON_ID=67004 /ORGANISM="Thalassiosira weissflogii, Strain CCMP1336" /LENGTH=401 /DNA_ID=CAMNT_0011914681 /DNA_START=62 /DNA_END=1264 /DNA_ORIENTATION=-